MADLHPSPGRLALLAAVDAGTVMDGITDDDAYLVDPAGVERPRKVTAQARKMAAAGWIELPDGPDAAPVYYQLTDTGRIILASPAAPRGGFSRQQLADHLRLALFQVDRAIDAGLIPPAGAAGGWSGPAAGALASRVEEIRTTVGSVPDLGAVRAAELLSERFDRDVPASTLPELAAAGVIPCVGYYKEHPLYCGQALERFTDLQVLERAIETGRLHTADEAAGVLRIRRADLDHLVRAGRLTPTTWVHSGWQRRRESPAVPLYRHGDLDQLAADRSIDWEAVRATAPGRRSPLAALPTAGGGR